MATTSVLDGCEGWDNTGCEGTALCPPRCPRFVDQRGTTVLVRPIAEADVDADELLSLYDCGAEAHSLSYPPYSTTRGLSSWLSDLLSDGWNVVAMDVDRLIGHAVLTPADAEEPEFGVFVDPDYRGRGIAAELLRHAIAYASAEDCRGLVMSVERGNRAMRSIATAHGFEVVEQPDEGDWVGFVSYSLALSDLSPVERVGPLTARRNG